MLNLVQQEERVAQPKVLLRSLIAEDLNGVAALHLKVFPTSAVAKLGQEAARRYYEWLLLGPHDADPCGAFVDEACVGYCFGGHFRGPMAGFVSENSAYLAWRVLSHPWLIRNEEFRSRLKQGRRVLRKQAKSNLFAPESKESQPHSFGILVIAVGPQCQGLGIGKLLMQRAEGSARARGCREMHLTVHTDNHEAVRFYERLGWQKAPWKGEWVGDMTKSLFWPKRDG